MYDSNLYFWVEFWQEGLTVKIYKYAGFRTFIGLRERGRDSKKEGQIQRSSIYYYSKVKKKGQRKKDFIYKKIDFYKKKERFV